MTDSPKTVDGLSRKIRRVIVKQLTSKPIKNIAEMEAQTAWIDSQIEVAVTEFAESKITRALDAFAKDVEDNRCPDMSPPTDRYWEGYEFALDEVRDTIAKHRPKDGK